MSPDGAKFWLNNFGCCKFSFSTFAASLHGKLSLFINTFGGSFIDSGNNIGNKIIFFIWLGFGNNRYRGGDGLIKVDLIWIWFLQKNVKVALLGSVPGEPSSNVGGLLVVTTAAVVRAVVPGHLLGGEAELEGGERINGEEGGNGADIGRLLGVGLGKWERDDFNHGTGLDSVGSG